MSLALAAALLASGAWGASIDDSDLSRPDPGSAARLEAEALARPGKRAFALKAAGAPQALAAGAGERLLTGRVLLRDGRGAAPARLARVTIEGGASAAVGMDGRFALPVDASAARARLTLSLDNEYWRFEGANGGYEWRTPELPLGPGGADAGDLSPQAGSENDKLGALHLAFVDGLAFLEGSADTEWWKAPLNVRWPGSSDHFEPWSWTVEISNAAAWDVSLHELGHAVMHGAMRAARAGGSHKIDECYSKELAWSEGWPTFFAAASRLQRSDPDARFSEHLVPRRAPIRLENVPDDVCKGPANEWRVAAALWDLYDSHADGNDGVSLDFSALWQAARAGRTDGIDSVWALLEPRLEPGLRAPAEAALVFNTVVPRRPAPPALALERHAAPNYDGR